MEKITLPWKFSALVSIFIFSTIVFSTASTSDLIALEITVDSIKDVTCPGEESGAITISVSGGTGLYTYSWKKIDDGTTYSVNAPNITGLGAGNYEVLVTDEGGDSITSNPIKISVSDSEAPVISATDVYGSADFDSCFAQSVALNVSVSDNCSVGEPTGTRDDNLPLTDPYPVGETVITWNVTDDNGNAADPVEQRIFITDDQSPVAAATNFTAYLDATGNVTVTTADIDNGSRDNCPAALALSLSKYTFSCADLGDNLITLTASDGRNFDSEMEITVTVVDDLAPVITAEPIIVPTDSGECFATVAMTATAEDNCASDSQLTGVRSDGLPLTDPFEIGTTTITWTA